MGKVVLHSTPTLNVADLYEMIHLDSSWKRNWHFFTHKDQLQVLDDLMDGAPFRVEKIEHDLNQDGLEVPAFRFGNPKGIPVLLWARQHGDEPECTAAINTILWILFNQVGNIVIAELLHHINFIVAPMINPAGTNRFSRISLVGVDINRDADATATGGSKLLTFLRETYKPKFCFNMHDMNPRKDRPTGEPELVTLAFQAAPYNAENSDNLTRLRSKTVIGYIVEQIKPYVPRISRYASNYMPRGFGDKSMGNGISCILVESGSLLDDEGGDAEVAKLHALAVLVGLHAIAHGFDDKLEGHTYETLPFDEGVFDFDVALRHGEVFDIPTNQRFKADVGIQKHLLDDHVSRDRQFRSEIASLGDLGPEKSIVDLEAYDSLILPGLIAVFPENPFDDQIPTELQARQLLQLGVTSLALPFDLPGNQSELEFTRRAIFNPPYMNIIPFLRVENLPAITARFGSSELVGLSVQGSWSVEAVELFTEKCEHKIDQSYLSEPITGTLFFTAGKSASQRHARLQIGGGSNTQHAEPISKAELNEFITSFQLTSSQLSYGVELTEKTLGLGLVPQLSKQAFATCLCPDKIIELHRESVAFAEQFNLNTLGSVRVQNQADLVAYATVKDSLQVLPTTVILNGEVAVSEKMPSLNARLARWFFANHE